MYYHRRRNFFWEAVLIMKKCDSRILDIIRGIWEKRVTMIFLIVLIPILLNFNTHIITDKTISINSYLIILSFIIDLFIGIMWFYTNPGLFINYLVHRS